MDNSDKNRLISDSVKIPASEMTPVTSLTPNSTGMTGFESKPIVDYLDIATKLKSQPSKYVKRQKYRKPPKKTWWKLIFRLLFSHIGLSLLVCGYAVLGAWLFIKIELPAEETRREKKLIRALEINDTITYLADVFWYWQNQNYTQEVWTSKVREKLIGFDHYIVESVAEFKYDGEYDTWNYDWVFSKSLLLTVTTISTIGYGHITPKTELGMIFTILYAVLGIPLLFLFLANIGDIMAKSFKFGYSRFCCRWCRSRRKISEYRKGDDSIIVPRCHMRLANEKVGVEEYMPTDEAHVPIILNLTVISVYIIIGSVIFSRWEGWNLTESAYFTFVTFATIGFGDYVPGRSFLTYSNSFGASLRMLFTCFYCAFGMALVSMSITLMQEQIKAKIHWIAVEVGIVKTPEELKKEEEQLLAANNGNITS
ncbi:hypothetical protein CHUAL_011038 [Chamberlinius hualienensis]